MNLMSHLIAGFPDAETSIAIADALVKGGANILEIQLAFSDPSADGPAIQTASTVALEKGYSTKQGLEVVKKIHERHPETPIYIMTYGSLAFTPGVENFVKMCKDAGVSACIIPDLPFDCDEGLTDACKKHGGFYLGTIGGVAAILAQDNIKSIECVEYPELGMEAVWKIRVEDFPAFILVDDKGNDFFKKLGL